MSLINSMLLKLGNKKKGNPSKRLLVPSTNTSGIDPVLKFKSKMNPEVKVDKTEAGKLIITPDQLEALKAAYKDMPSSILPGTPNYLKVTAILNVFDLASVKKISLANIPTLSKIAKELVGDKTEAGKLIITPEKLNDLKVAYKNAPKSIGSFSPNYWKAQDLLLTFDFNSVQKIAMANIPTLSPIAKKLIGDKEDKTESELLKTGIDNSLMDHTHEFILGDNKTLPALDGHDHFINYDNGKPISTGPAPDDGHKHKIEQI